VVIGLQLQYSATNFYEKMLKKGYKKENLRNDKEDYSPS
jgi:hypothetical protein